MTATAFSKILERCCQENHLKISSQTFDKFVQLFALTQKWGAKINLTSNLTPDSFIQENILDPLLAYDAFQHSSVGQNLLVRFKSPNKPAFIDIGCGGGFVGLIWLIYSEHSIQMTLLDRDRRKINFCRQVIRELHLDGICAEHESLETFSLNNRQLYDACVSRATIGELLYFQNCAQLLKKEGIAFYFSSSSAISAAQNSHLNKIAYQILPGSIHRYLTYSIYE
jgi:16S rRNA (guanine(527)-N(7))-methyltransferase RsmG